MCPWQTCWGPITVHGLSQGQEELLALAIKLSMKGRPWSAHNEEQPPPGAVVVVQTGLKAGVDESWVGRKQGNALVSVPVPVLVPILIQFRLWFWAQLDPQPVLTGPRRHQQGKERSPHELLDHSPVSSNESGLLWSLRTETQGAVAAED
ncbi:hypothetical protein JEQ12_006011 [Ovis aries]|uniref:Uncharacterized protein n=1 Tax=Ovis aries TaxID=9940 RepID=A0A835ZSY0_SHEEP|nr:hypothetical protein JEQ12_006011 [Ovis aries]